MKPRREVLDVLFDALTNRPWKRVLAAALVLIDDTTGLR